MFRAGTRDNAGCEREIMINDVSRAYFYAEATRCMYIEIPTEDPLHDPNMLGRLRLCLYGTRDAALNWQQTLSDHLVEAGFKRGELVIRRSSTTPSRTFGLLFMATTIVVPVRQHRSIGWKTSSPRSMKSRPRESGKERRGMELRRNRKARY